MKISKAYFPHDFNARLDIKIKRLRKDLGAEGYGIFWMIIETLCTSNNFRYSIKDIDLLADEFGVSFDKVNDVIRNYDLFAIDEDNNFYSISLVARLQKFVDFSKKQQEKAKIRWGKSEVVQSNGNAVALPEQNNGSAEAMLWQSNGNAYKDKIRKDNNNPPPTPPLLKNEEVKTEDVLFNYYRSVYGRMGVVEQEFVVYLLENFGFDNAKRLIREFRELNFRSVKTMKLSLTKDGKIKPREEQNVEKIAPKLENWEKLKCEICGKPVVTESEGIKACTYEHILEIKERRKSERVKL